MKLGSRLNFKEHINKLRAKAKRTLNNIKVVAGKTLGGDQKTLKNYTVQYVKQKKTMTNNYIRYLLQEN